MSDAELLHAMRIYEERRIALAKAEEDLHVGMAARQCRKEMRATTSRVPLPPSDMHR